MRGNERRKNQIFRTLDQLNLENGGCHDSLTYVQGQDLESGKMLKRLCGTELDESPTVVLSPGHEVTHVVFKSDYSINNRGFNVSYQVISNGLWSYVFRGLLLGKTS